jgi:hypothetical protein
MVVAAREKIFLEWAWQITGNAGVFGRVCGDSVRGMTQDQIREAERRYAQTKLLSQLLSAVLRERKADLREDELLALQRAAAAVNKLFGRDERAAHGHLR